MRELSVFIDESGDFGAYDPHSPYYIVTLVFHDQSLDISENIHRFRHDMSYKGTNYHIVHAGPLIRRESEYKNLDFTDRKKIFNSLFHFVRLTDITYHSIIVEKKNLSQEIDLNIQITKQLSRFLNDNSYISMKYDRIVVYYDYGQLELSSILLSVFYATFNNVELKKVFPADYTLLQAADMLCTLELLALKCENKVLSNSELKFFKSSKDLYRSYIQAIRKKRI